MFKKPIFQEQHCNCSKAKLLVSVAFSRWLLPATITSSGKTGSFAIILVAPMFWKESWMNS